MFIIVQLKKKERTLTAMASGKPMFLYTGSESSGKLLDQNLAMCSNSEEDCH